MGKKKAGGGAGLGRALIKERLQAGRGNKRNDTWVLKVTVTKLGYIFFPPHFGTIKQKVNVHLMLGLKCHGMVPHVSKSAHGTVKNNLLPAQNCRTCFLRAHNHYSCVEFVSEIMWTVNYL